MKKIKIGDVVIPKQYASNRKLNVLFSKNIISGYTHVICVSLSPFVLMNDRASMTFTKFKKADFAPLCKADQKIIDACVKSYNSEP